ncbi:hypothetical protein ACVCAH_18955 [Micromonospora sp. LZ34]
MTARRSGPKDPQENMTVRGSLLWQVFTAVLLAASVATVTTILFWLLLGRPKLAVSGAALSVSDFYAGLRISLAVVAGLGAVVALVVAYRRQRFNEAQHFLSKAAEARESTKLYGERFKSASEQLGSTDASVRLAGAYAMLNLADDWKSNRQMCVDVLCGYLRMPFDIPDDDSELSYSRVYSEAVKFGPTDTIANRLSRADKEIRQELQVRLAIQRALAAHLRNPEKKHKHGQEMLEFWPSVRIDLFGATLCNFDFEGCEVSRADFRRATFLGDATFCEFHVSGQAHFAQTTFFGGAGFRGAVFDGDLNFVDSRFKRKAIFAGAKIGVDGEFNDSVFESDANFGGSRFGAGAYFPDVRFMATVSFTNSRAKDGHDLSDAVVANVEAAHKLPSGFKLVDGRLQPVK